MKEYEVYSQRFRREDLEGEKGFNPKVLPAEYLTSPRATHTFVYVSTIQRMTINLFGWEHAFPQYSSDPDYEEDTGRETYDQLEDEREFATQDIEQKITSPDSNSKIIQEVAKYAYQHQEETGRFPKILIFAANDLPHTSHCDQLVGICKETFGQGDDFVKKITGSPSVDRPLQRIREFRNRPNPKIVVTVDMLTTGVDIPPLEFIVFLRPYFVKVLVKRLRRIERTMSGEAMEAFSAFIPDGDMCRFVDRLPGMLQEDFPDAMKLLRNKQFQDLLINYPRTKSKADMKYG